VSGLTFETNGRFFVRAHEERTNSRSRSRRIAEEHSGRTLEQCRTVSVVPMSANKSAWPDSEPSYWYMVVNEVSLRSASSRCQWRVGGFLGIAMFLAASTPCRISFANLVLEQDCLYFSRPWPSRGLVVVPGADLSTTVATGQSSRSPS